MTNHTTSLKRLLTRTSNYYSDESYQHILATIHPKCYVEAESQGRGGTITDIVRDRWGVPVAVYVIRGSYEDCIAADEISFYEPYYPAAMIFVDDDRFFTELYPYNRPPERSW